MAATRRDGGGRHDGDVVVEGRQRAVASVTVTFLIDDDHGAVPQLFGMRVTRARFPVCVRDELVLGSLF